jgi:hypothetical protein
MKRVLFICLLLIFSSQSIAQEYKFAVSSNILNLALKGPSLSISYAVSDKWSIQGYGATGKSTLFNNYQFKTGILDVRYHFWELAYVGPYLRYIEKSVQRDGFVNNTGFFSSHGRDFQGRGLSSGVCLGLQLTKSNRFNLETFAGAGYGGFISQQGDRTESGFLDVRVGVLTGINF